MPRYKLAETSTDKRVAGSATRIHKPFFKPALPKPQNLEDTGKGGTETRRLLGDNRKKYV